MTTQYALATALMAASLAACAGSHPMVSELDQRCTNNDAWACFKLAVVLTDGRLTPPDKRRAVATRTKAVQLTETGCGQERDGEACHLLAARLYMGTIDGLQQDIPRAKRLFRKGCDYGSVRACAMLQQIHQYGDAAAHGGRGLDGLIH